MDRRVAQTVTQSTNSSKSKSRSKGKGKKGCSTHDENTDTVLKKLRQVNLDEKEATLSATATSLHPTAKQRCHVESKQNIMSTETCGPEHIQKPIQPGRLTNFQGAREIPGPTPEYLEHVHRPVQPRLGPQPLLVVLDLNGTILFRKRRQSKNPMPRPHLTQFLEWLLRESSHKTMVWSSVMPQNAASMVPKIFGDNTNKLVATWARDTLRLSRDHFRNDAPVYKRLDWVWANEVIQASYPHDIAEKVGISPENRKWHQHNTVLIDDSSDKAVTQPFNHIRVPEFTMPSSTWKFEEEQVNVLNHVKSFLERASQCDDISRFIRLNPFSFDEILTGQLSLPEETENAGLANSENPA